MGPRAVIDAVEAQMVIVPAKDPRTIFRYLEKEQNPMPSGASGSSSGSVVPPVAAPDTE